MKDQIQLEATYPHPPERVWKALTDPEALSQWLLPADFKPLIGYRFRLDLPEKGAIRGKVTDVEEGRLLAYTWEDDEDGQGSMVVWTLQPTDGGTKVTLNQVTLPEPVVTRLPIDAHFNWSYAIRHGLPGLLRLLQAQESTAMPPVLYTFAEVVNA